MEKTIKILLLIIFITHSQYLFADDIEIKGSGTHTSFDLFKTINRNFEYSEKIKVKYQYDISANALKGLKEGKDDFIILMHYPTYEEKNMLEKEILTIPFGFTSLSICFNIPGMKNINIDADIISGIFSGKIKKWDSLNIKELNTGRRLPDKKIILINYPDPSEKTLILTELLSKSPNSFSSNIKMKNNIKYNNGIIASNNNWVPLLIKNIPYSLGYTGTSDALKNGLSTASLKNSSGNNIKPELAGIGAAISVSAWEELRKSFTNSNNPKSYPLTSLLWIIMYKDQDYKDRDIKRAEALYHYFDWILGPGQGYYRKNLFIPLTEGILEYSKRRLRTMNYKKKSLGD